MWDEDVVSYISKGLAKFKNFTTPQFINAAGGFIDMFLPGLGSKIKRAYSSALDVTPEEVYRRAIQYVRDAAQDSEKAQRALSKIQEMKDAAHSGSIAEQTIDKSNLDKSEEDARKQVSNASMKSSLGYDMLSNAQQAVHGNEVSSITAQKNATLAKAYESIK